MSAAVPARVLAAVERNRRRVWALCYRMTGNRADADDLAQESIARAIERADQCSAADPTGWLLQLASRLCLDHLRSNKVRRRLTELVDPLEEPEWAFDQAQARRSAENALVLQEDIRFAIVVALQCLSGKQRAALILRDVYDRSLNEIATTVDSNENAVKALLRRARTALAGARGHRDVDVPADAAVVERFAQAVQGGNLEHITALLAEDVWGVADGGGVVVTAKKPTFGVRTVSQQWANARTKLAASVTTEVRRINGEAAIVVRLAEMPAVVVALVHLETRAGRIAAQRVLRDPRRLGRLVSPAPGSGPPLA